jgi:hypothetical protein
MRPSWHMAFLKFVNSWCAVSLYFQFGSVVRERNPFLTLSVQKKKKKFCDLLVIPLGVVFGVRRCIATQGIPPVFYGTRRFRTVFTNAHHWPLSRSRWVQCTPSQPISLRSILLLSSHLRLGLPKWSLPFRFSNQIMYAFISPIRATCAAHLILLDEKVRQDSTK